MTPKPQMLYIHGGMTFKNKKGYRHYLKTRPISLEKKNSWSGQYLDKKFARQFQIIRPQMPLKENAVYADWKTHFERYFPFLKNNCVLIGTSLGGIFLAKYLSENTFPKKIKAVFLVCPPFDGSLSVEDLTGGFKLKSNLSLLQKNAKKLFLLFSANDPVVPVSHAKKYQAKLPNATIKIFKNKNGHFKIATFPKIIRMIKNLL